MKNERLLPILLVNFIGTLGFSIVLPFLVVIVSRFGGGPIIYGFVGATYSAFQFIGGPLLGRWSDKIGRRKVLLFSQAGTLLSWIIFLIALFLPQKNIWLISLPLIIIFIARALDGITGGNISVANAYLADITPEKNRSKNFGKMGISSNLGFMIGPALAGILGATFLNEVLPVTAALLISLFALIIIWLYLPEASAKKPNKETISFTKILQVPNALYMLTLTFIMFLAFNVFYTAFPIHAIQGLNWTIFEMGIYFSFLSIVMVIIQGPVLSFTSQKCSELSLVIAGSLGMVLSFYLMTFPQQEILYGAAFFFSLGNGLMWPSFQTLLSKVCTQNQGAIQGLATSAGSLASIIGLIAGGFLYSAMQEKSFLVSSAIFVIIVILTLRFSKKK